MPTPRDVKSIGGLLHPGADSDYGRRGRAEWLDIDWQRHQHKIEIDGHEANYVELGEGPAARVRARARRVVAVVAGEHPGVRARPPRRGDGPARLRLLGDARPRDLDRVLRELDLPAAGRARDRLGGRGGQLDGRLQRGRHGDPQPRAREEPHRRLRRRVLAELPPRPAARRARAAVGRVRRPRSDAHDRRRGDAAAPALVGARHGRLPLSAPDRAGARPRARAQRQADRRLPPRAGGAGRLPARGGAAEDLRPDADRVGRPRHARPGQGRRADAGADPGLALRGVRAHRPRRDAGAPGALQQAPARVPGRDAEPSRTPPLLSG